MAMTAPFYANELDKKDAFKRLYASLIGFRESLKLNHLSTNSWQDHLATDKVYEEVDDLIDTLGEVYFLPRSIDMRDIKIDNEEYNAKDPAALAMTINAMADNLANSIDDNGLINYLNGLSQEMQIYVGWLRLGMKDGLQDTEIEKVVVPRIESAKKKSRMRAFVESVLAEADDSENLPSTVPEFKWDEKEAQEIEDSLEMSDMGQTKRYGGSADEGIEEFILDYLEKEEIKRIQEYTDEEALESAQIYLDEVRDPESPDFRAEFQNLTDAEIAEYARQSLLDSYMVEQSARESLQQAEASDWEYYRALYSEYLQEQGKLTREEAIDAIMEFIQKSLEKSGYDTGRINKSHISDSCYLQVSYADEDFIEIRISDHLDKYGDSDDRMELYFQDGLLENLQIIKHDLPIYWAEYLKELQAAELRKVLWRQQESATPSKNA